MASIFSKIVAGEIPSYKVAENDRFYAFLDINPLVKGHTLVIPKREVDYIFDLTDDELAGIHLFARQVALAIQRAFPCRKVGEAVIGLEVPHAHIHLIPMQKPLPTPSATSGRRQTSNLLPHPHNMQTGRCHADIAPFVFLVRRQADAPRQRYSSPIFTCTSLRN